MGETRVKFLYTDDRTGRFSGTTLRTWLLFALFFAQALLLILGPFIGYAPGQAAMDLLSLLGMFAVGGGALYLGKRFSEDRWGAPFRPSPMLDQEESKEDVRRL